MKIQNITLFNFRNIKPQTIKFHEGLNVFMGKNAQGKTNILEAIFFGCIGKSLRVSKEKEVIAWGQQNAKISLDINSEFDKRNIEIYFSDKQKKTVKINHLPINRIGELMGEFHCVYFSPDELRLISGSPEARRRFMDITISQIDKHYFYCLNRFEKVLLNRNKLLKDNLDKKVLKETISIWDEQFSSLASKIISARNNFLKQLAPYAEMAHAYISNQEETLKITYIGSSEQEEEQIKKQLLVALKKNIEKDIKLGFTSVGPHRDDIKITLNDIDVRLFGSQGQKRSAALSLKLAELEIINNQTNEMPVLLLDDVLSELDEKRQERLMKFTQKAQTILTCNSFNKKADRTFVVSNGKVAQL